MIYNTDIFIQRCKEVHGNRYDYSKVEYVCSKSKVVIICDEHGEFEQTPNLHLSGSGCAKCYYESISMKIDSCPIHGSFYQSVSVHLSGSGCKECMKDSFRNGFELFKSKALFIHGDLFEYYPNYFIDMRTKTKIKCKKHGDFWITPDNHISKKGGCLKCSNNISKMEKEWLDINDVKDRQIKIKINDKLYKVDGLINKTVYEFYGDFWHGNPNIFKSEDTNPLNKKKFGELYQNTIDRELELISNGYNIISIWESEFKNIYKNKNNL